MDGPVLHLYIAFNTSKCRRRARRTIKGLRAKTGRLGTFVEICVFMISDGGNIILVPSDNEMNPITRSERVRQRVST